MNPAPNTLPARPASAPGAQATQDSVIPRDEKGGILHDFVPRTEAELKTCLKDAKWRVCSGQLYKILVKNEKDDADEGKIERFLPNRAQKRFMARMWHRNVILKARQLGLTTLICILWLDHAVFQQNQRCVLIAQDLPKATEIFRDKIKFAYERLPPVVKEACPPVKWTETELLLANNSAIKVTNSPRSGTPDRLHISEMGKIGAKTPHKAKEIVTGGFPAVPSPGGIIVIESTAEGQEGEFHAIVMKAKAKAEAGKPLNPKEFRLHFYAWWQDENYTMPVSNVTITADDEEYFKKVEAIVGGRFSQGQKNWYVTTRDADFSGNEELMWQEYPSYPEEAFQVSSEGTYYAKQLTAARRQKRIGFFPYADGIPVHTFWDIGRSDGTGIWLMQQIGAEHRFLEYIEEWGEGYSYYTGELQKRGYTWGIHHLPHDADHKRQEKDTMTESPKDKLESLMPGNWEIVPRVDEIVHGINLTRAAFSSATFDEAGCKKGLLHLGAYRKEWSENTASWKPHPRKDIHSECADAFRQYGQGFEPKRLIAPPKGKPRAGWKTA